MSSASLGSALMLQVVTNLGDKFELAVENDMTVGQMRALVGAMSSRPANAVSDEDIAVKLSVRGVQLLDDDAQWCQVPINHASIENGEKLYASIVRQNDSSAAKGAHLPAGLTGAPTLRQRPGDSRGSGVKSARDEAEANQRLQAQMMEPMIDAMVQNPQFFDSMISMQPALKRIIDENPEAGRELRNPEVLKQLLMSQMDPDQRRQMNQTLRLQMAQLQNTPGGSAMLEKYFHGVTSDASTSTQRTAADLHETTESQLRPDLSKTSNDSALPNPWQPSQPPPPPSAQHYHRQNGVGSAGGGSFLQEALGRPGVPWFLTPPSPLDSAGPFSRGAAVLPSTAPPAGAVAPLHPLASVAPASASSEHATSSVPTQSTADVAPDYSEQLVILLEMGFGDEDLCREALHACHGDVDAAVCYIAEKQERG